MSIVSWAMRCALVGRHVLERAHVVQAVGELDQQDADILGHGEQQLAQIFGLGGFLGDQVEARDLGQPVDQRGDLVAEFFLDLAWVASVSSTTS